jgi:UDP-N-acetylmuramyl pentapeptide phosphotransferase/UDP-N-acetylglucosamine-1-phosphate transferase
VSGPGAFVAVAAVSAVGTALARRYALRRRLVDEPGERRSHSVATPRGGGAGPVLAVLGWLLATQGAADGTTWLVTSALAGVALVGLWDDHASLPASWRLLVHLLAGIAVAAALVDPRMQPLAFVLVAALVAGLVNVWNFMDGINGIAASQAAIVAVAVAVAMPSTATAGIAVAAACVGFLPFNFPRARIFLGDVGSGALGLLVAWLCARAGASRIEGALLVMLPLSAFLVDAGLTLARRMFRRERWWEPHAQHLYQAMARRHGHAVVTLAYAAWTSIASLAMLALRDASAAFIMASLGLCYTTAAMLWRALQHEVATERDVSSTRDP